MVRKKPLSLLSLELLKEVEKVERKATIAVLKRKRRKTHPKRIGQNSLAYILPLILAQRETNAHISMTKTSFAKGQNPKGLKRRHQQVQPQFMQEQPKFLQEQLLQVL